MFCKVGLLFAVCASVHAIVYYNDQKENCTRTDVRNSFCYGGPRFDADGQYKSCSVAGVFAITFDDTPSPYTASILDTLKKYNMKATFNVIGKKIASRPDLIQRMADEGHQVASHTYSHTYLTQSTDVVAEMMRFEVAFVRENFTGVLANSVIPNYMRAPHGDVNASIMSALNTLGYIPVHWGFLTHDSDGISEAEILAGYYSHFGGVNVTNVNFSGLNIISQQHDTELETAQSLDDVLNYLNRTFVPNGVRFVTVAECLGSVVPPYKTNNRLQNDPMCQNGFIRGNTCCLKSCGGCGGSGCSLLNGGAEGCCVTNIQNANYTCKLSPAPCVIR